jgi:GTP-binding protein
MIRPMSSPLQLQFVLSAPDLGSLPDTTVEVALVGRSNVGKSSLVNSLANRKVLAQVSKTPGRTRLINLYELGDGRAVVDLPGYGYAAVPERMRSSWQQMVEGYLRGREQLAMVLLVVDGEVGPTKLDVRMLEWLRGHGLPHTVVATKHDKVKASQRSKRVRDVAAGCGLDPSEVMWVSAAKGTGIEKLRGRVMAWLS